MKRVKTSLVKERVAVAAAAKMNARKSWKEASYYGCSRRHQRAW